MIADALPEFDICPELRCYPRPRLNCGFGCACCGPLSKGRRPHLSPISKFDGESYGITKFDEEYYSRSMSKTSAIMDGDRSASYVDTHVHLEMVLQKLNWYESAPSTCAKSWEELTDNEKRCWKVLGLSPCFWNGFCQKNGNTIWFIQWRGLTTIQQRAASALGWDSISWNGKEWPLPRRKLWCELEESMREHLRVLGETETSWDELFCKHEPAGYVDGGDMRSWDDLWWPEQDAATELGFTPETWNMEQMADVQAYINDFCGSGFEACICQGCDSESLDDSVKLALAHPQVFATFGCHPKLAWLWEQENMEKRILEAFDVCGKKAVAWGEFGLDFSNPLWWDNEEYIQSQIDIFTRQLQLAVERKLPLVLHIREAADEALPILQKWVPREWKAHVHGFHGPSEFVHAIIDSFPNFYFGLCGTVSMGLDGDGARMGKLVPLEKMLLETDGPYILPRGTLFNHCGQIPLIARLVADLRGCSAAEVLEKARTNSRHVYGI